MSSQPLSGKVALVTGASGGIGAEVARKLALAGASVALHYSSGAARARELARELRVLNARAETFRADLLKPGAAKPLISSVVSRLGRLDILVNNAGAVLGDQGFEKLSERDFERTLRLNLGAPFFLSREAFKAMDGGGRIINVTSIGAKFGGSPRSFHYAAAKGGLETLTLGLSRAGASRGILVNAVRAGVIDTPFHGKFRKNMGERTALIPLKRLGKPADVAQLAAYLCGPGGDYITGQVLSVTGGE